MRQKILAMSVIYSFILISILSSGITTKKVVVSLVVYLFMAVGLLFPKKMKVAKNTGFAMERVVLFLGNTIAFVILIVNFRDMVAILIGEYVISNLVLYLLRENEQIHEKIKSQRDTLIENEYRLKHEKRMLIQNQDNEIRMATMRERDEIARELHDNVGHMLSRSLLLSGAIRTVNKDEMLEDKLTILENTLDEALKEMRKTVHRIHNENIHVESSIHEIVRALDDKEVVMDLDFIDDLDEQIKVSVIAIVREAVSNIIRHSNCSRVEIRLKRFLEFMNLSIYDDGSISAEVKERIQWKLNDGIGLNGMSERVKILGGTVNIYTDWGFKIFVHIPLSTQKNSRKEEK